MKRTSAIALLLVVFLGGAALAAPMKVTVSKVAGTVEVKAGAGWKALKNGDTVPVGAEVKTGAGSSCILTWAGGNVAKVKAQTTLSVSADKTGAGDEKSSIALKAGGVSAHAKKLSTRNSSFEVKTPTAVAGVRGTDIIAEIEAGNVTFGVSDGNLEVTVGDEVFMVDDGFLVNISEMGEFTEPIPIPADMMEKLEKEFDEIRTESANTQAQGGDEDAVEEEPVEEESTGVESGDEDPAGNVVDSIEDINDALDNQVNEDVVEAAEGEFITGTVEVEIQFQSY